MFEATSTEHAGGTASAPGDLPMPAIAAREADKAHHFRHDNTMNPMTPLPGEPVKILATSGVGVRLRSAKIVFTADGSSPDLDSPAVTMEKYDVVWRPETGYLDRWSGVIPGQSDGTVVRYRLIGTDAAGALVPAHDGSGFWFQLGSAGLSTFAYRVARQPYVLPVWMRDATTYHVFLDRFRSDEPTGKWTGGQEPSGRHGGTLNGLTAALGHLEDLGIRCIWVSPIGPSPSYHRYDQLDYFDVDAELGGLDAARRLVAAAHDRGMRVVLDFVPSHASWKMPEFVAAQRDRAAATSSWFVFDEWPDRYRCFLNVVPALVSLDGTSPELRRHVIDSAIFWLADVGFDGLRLDHVIGHGSDFWVAFSEAVLAAKPEAALIGEATDTPDMLRRYSGTLQSVLDFPLAHALRLSLARGQWSVEQFDTYLRAYTEFMREGPDRVTFLDNHDINRFLFLADGDTRRLRMALTVLLTLPYPPVIYYGTEIGLSQSQDKDSGGFGGDHVVRADMPWDPADWDAELLLFCREAIALRNRHATIRHGEFHGGTTNLDDQTYTYSVSQDAETVMVTLNLSPEAREVGTGASAILLSSAPAARLDRGVVTLPAMSAVVLSGGKS